MSRGVKLILAAVVLIVGGGVAWQYRQRGGDASSEPASAAPLAPAHVGSTGLNGGSGPIATANDQSSRSAATIAPSPKVAGIDSGTPQLSAAYPGKSAGDGQPPLPIGADPEGRSIDRNPRWDGLGESSLGPTHKLADGDTLAELAKRYLGSVNRWPELYDYNRDVLTNPDLLPIGAELRIPVVPFRPTEGASIAGGAPTTQPAVARPVSQPTETSTVPSNPPSELVPVPGATSNSASGVEPKAKLRRLPPVGPAAPFGRALRVAPRTYVVQPGETLHSIAEKLYGDGAREDRLREANRNLVAGPQDLRPGMVLVVPMAD